MEIRVNLVLLGVLIAAWGALLSTDPVAAMDPLDEETRALARLEDDFARDRSNIVLARRLSERYLEIGRPGLAVAALRSAEPGLLDDPMLAHRLAQAYESSGRVLDAHATASLALARCGRALGTEDSSPATPVPAHACTERQYAALEAHTRALEHMVRWGVAEPARDPRAQLAYDLALRRAHVASAE